MRLIFPNPDRILVPGQFVTVQVTETERPSLPVVPQTAVLQDREGRYVFVLGKTTWFRSGASKQARGLETAGP